ncbi:uncharacterized protein [Nicotiana tomentosiformis]|uniref:uncharacterized protein n=1 Tax=Nicotiana tomentosiformis TaxID=4098 RepID=UPI00388C5AB0
MYLKLRGDFPKCRWRRLTCNNYDTPRWVFSLFLGLNGRLKTRDRIAKWSVVDDLTCHLYAEDPEILDHLLFKCSISSVIRKKILQWKGVDRGPYQWKDEVFWAIDHVKGNSAKEYIYKMSLAACVFHLDGEKFEIVSTKSEISLDYS